MLNAWIITARWDGANLLVGTLAKWTWMTCRGEWVGPRARSRRLLHRLGAAIAIGACLWPIAVPAAQIGAVALRGGEVVEYAFVLPDGFQAERAYPAILAFPGGRQSLRGALGTLERFWESEAAKRGYIVISPAAPPDKPYFGAGALLIPEFVSHLTAAYRIAGGRFHIGGHSNGGVSAFRVAGLYPDLLNAITVFAGFPEEQEDFDRLANVAHLPVTMFVGNGDAYWKAGMIRVRDRLCALGNKPYLEIVPRNGHFLPDLTYENSWRIFDRIEARWQGSPRPEAGAC